MSSQLVTGTAGLSQGYGKVKALDPNLPKFSKAGTEPQQHSQASELLFSVYFLTVKMRLNKSQRKLLCPQPGVPLQRQVGGEALT